MSNKKIVLNKGSIEIFLKGAGTFISHIKINKLQHDTYTLT